MTTETSLTELTQYVKDINEVLDAILDALGTTKLVVTFDTLSGSTLKNSTYFKGQSFGSLPIPYKEGYEFGGWYTFRDYNEDTMTYTYLNLVENYSDVMTQGKITLYAKWLTKQHAVYLDAGDNGSVIDGRNVLSVRLGAPLSSLPAATSGGRSFIEWLVETSDRGLVPVNKDTCLSTWMLDENEECHLVASYGNCSVEISAIYIYGEYENTAGPLRRGSPNAVFTAYSNVTYNTEAAWASNLRNKDMYYVANHSFAGLALTKNGKTREEAEKTYTPFDNTILYAVWKPYQYYIKYYLTDKDETLLRKQVLYADEVGEILFPDELMSEPFKSKFTKWNYRDGINVDSHMINLVNPTALPGKPVCNLVAENNGYIRLYAFTANELQNINLDYLSSENTDWASIDKITGEQKYTQGDEIELADYRMYIFRDDDPAADEVNEQGKVTTNHTKYSIAKKIPTEVSPINANGNGLQQFTFKYSGTAYKTAPANCAYFIAVKKLPVDPSIANISILLLSSNFNNTFRYGNKIDLADLSVAETAWDSGNNLIYTKVYDYTDIVFEPIDLVTNKITESFNLSAKFRSYINDSCESSFVIPINVWNKTVGLSIIEPEISGELVPPVLPGRLGFTHKCFSGISVAGILDNGTCTSIEDYTHMSVMNIPEDAEVLLDSPKKLKICSCYAGESIPEISCLYSVAVEECTYSAVITKTPNKTVYTLEDGSIDLAGISGVLRYGTSQYPALAKIDLKYTSCFTAYYPNLTLGEINVPIYASYTFLARQGDVNPNGTFPYWHPFAAGDYAVAETTLPITVTNNTDILSITLSCGATSSGGKRTIDFSRLSPTIESGSGYKNTKFYMDFHLQDEPEVESIQMTGGLTKELRDKVVVVIKTDSNVYTNPDTMPPPIVCLPSNAANVGTSDFANYVTEIGGLAPVPEYFAQHCKEMRSKITLKFKTGVNIGQYAFHDTEGLTAIILENETNESTRPSSIKIADYAFLSAKDFTTFKPKQFNDGESYPAGQCTFPLASSGTLSVGKQAFAYTSKITSINFKGAGELEKVNNYAFSYMTSLTSADISLKSIKEIGIEAFANCSKLQSLKFNTSSPQLTSFETGAFQNCTKLTAIRFPESLKNIGNDAFRNCNELSSVSIIDNITSIGDYAFADCDNLTKAYIYNSRPTVLSCGRAIFNNSDYDATLKTVGATSKTSVYFKGISKPDDISVFTSKVKLSSSAYSDEYLGTGYLSTLNPHMLVYTFDKVKNKTILSAK